MPFSPEIMGTMVPPNLVGIKASCKGVEDPEAHLTAFHTQMMLSGGSDAVYCKMFISTLSGIAMEWFVSLPEGHITSFSQFSKLFTEQYIVNKAPAVVSYDMPGIDPDFLCHRLSMDPMVRPVRQRRRKFNEEKRKVIHAEAPCRRAYQRNPVPRVASECGTGAEGKRQVENVRGLH